MRVASDFVSHDATHAVAVYRKSEATTFVPLSHVLASVVHCEVPGGQVRALIPYEYQGIRAVAEQSGKQTACLNLCAFVVSLRHRKMSLLPF